MVVDSLTIASYDASSNQVTVLDWLKDCGILPTEQPRCCPQLYIYIYICHEAANLIWVTTCKYSIVALGKRL
jgi:hypothetical protein